MRKVDELEKKYKADQAEKREKIKAEPNKGKRFWKWVWYLITFPFIWIWYNLRDWRTLLIFGIVCLVVSCEVWIPYLIGFIVGSKTPLGISMISVGSACWIWWMLPGTPFIPLCIVITIGIKAFFNKMKERNKKDGEERD